MDEHFYITVVRDKRGVIHYQAARRVGKDRIGSIYTSPDLPPRKTRNAAQKDLSRWLRRNGVKKK